MGEIISCLQSPVRHVDAYITYWNGSPTQKENVVDYKSTDKLISISLERVCESGKFFGFGYFPKVSVKIMDLDHTFINGERNYLSVYIDGEEMAHCFKTSEINRDENTDVITITAYGLSKQLLNDYTFEDLKPALPTEEVTTTHEDGTTTTETVYQYGMATLLNVIGYTLSSHKPPTAPIADYVKYYSYVGSFVSADLAGTFNNLNLVGTETLKEVLDKAAESMGCFYYDGSRSDTVQSRTLVLHRIDKTPYTVYQITRNDYFTLTSKENRRLTTLTHTTELGNDVSVTTGLTGTTQFIKDNPFLDLLDSTEVYEKLDNLLFHLGDLSINQFEMTWRGSVGIPIGAALDIETKDGDFVRSYLLDDVITYDGGLTQKTRWEYGEVVDNTAETTTISEAINQTFAKVDKVNKTIDIVASDIQANTEEISSIKVNTDNLSLSVESIEKNLSESTELLNGQIEEVRNKAELALTPENVKIAITETLKTGVEEYTTETGFTFNNEGLTIDKSDSEMATQITEDGMVVYKNDEAMLTANNTGVYAQNLHATTYLIIGNNSRFEDYEKDGEARTGCFWLGGN